MRPALARRYDRFMGRMEDAWLREARATLLGGVAGSVVEIGAGTGANLTHYPDTVTSLLLTEPTAAMRDQLRTRAAGTDTPCDVEIVDATADELPLPDASVDAVVSTLVLCSVPDLARTAAELHRVLRPGGTLHLVEHVEATGGFEQRAQRFLDPVWTWIEGSCHLDHDTGASLVAAGFEIDEVERTRPRGQPPLFRDVLAGTARRP